MAPKESVSTTSQSPLKPRLFREFLSGTAIWDHIQEISDFDPFTEKDFYLAHRKTYVDRFFSTGDESNGLDWSPEFADTVRYTNSSLYHAIVHSIKNPDSVAVSPTAGFHHAIPERGAGFCTFSGQIIASLKIFRELGLSGAYLDLDEHFGNSIEDSRDFRSQISEAIPKGANYNPRGTNKLYFENVNRSLLDFGKKFREKKVHYLVFCHGADSHEWDDLGGSCNTEYWLKCSELVYGFIRKMRDSGFKVPLTISLFGGYRKDNYDSVLNLHSADISICLKRLYGIETGFIPDVKPRN